MIKSYSFSRVSQKKADDLQRRKDLAQQPTPGKMLAWLKGVKHGHVLVLVDKKGLPQDVHVDDVGRDFSDVLITHGPPGANRFRRLMRHMLSELGNVPPAGRQAAQSLLEGLASEFTRAYGVVWTKTLSHQLTALVDALEQDRQAREDLEGVDLLEPSHSARESPSSTEEPDTTQSTDAPAQSGEALHAAPDVVTDLEEAGIGSPPADGTSPTAPCHRDD